MGVFRAGELGYAGGQGGGLELGAGLGGDGAVREDRGEGEGAVDAGGVLECDSAGIARDAGVHLDAVELAVREAGLLDGVAGVGLGADVDVDFAGGRVIRADDDSLEQVSCARGGAVVRASEKILVGVLAVVREFVGLADFGRVTRGDKSEGFTFGASFFAIQEDKAVVAGARAGIIEGFNLGEVGGAGAEVGVGGGGSSPGGSVPHHLVETRGHEVATGDDLPGRGIDHPLGDETASCAVGTYGTLKDAGREIIPDFMISEDGHRTVAVRVSTKAVRDAGKHVSSREAADAVTDGHDGRRGPARCGRSEVRGLGAGRALNQALRGERDGGGRGDEEQTCDVFHV